MLKRPMRAPAQKAMPAPVRSPMPIRSAMPAPVRSAMPAQASENFTPPAPIRGVGPMGGATPAPQTKAPQMTPDPISLPAQMMKKGGSVRGSGCAVKGFGKGKMR